jgi:hypothetical protein
MPPPEGFNEYRRLYDERYRLQQTANAEFRSLLDSLEKRIGSVERQVDLLSYKVMALSAAAGAITMVLWKLATKYIFGVE